MVASEYAARLTRLRKKALASEAERLALGTGWLPLMLRAVEPEAQEEIAPIADSDKQAGNPGKLLAWAIFGASRAAHMPRAF